MRPRTKTLRYATLTSVVVVFAIACAIAWLVGTSAGAQWAIARAGVFLPQPLEVGSLSGTLAGELSAENIRYGDADTPISINARVVRIDLALPNLLLGTLHVNSAFVRGFQVTLREQSERASTNREPEPSSAFSLQPPIDIVLDDVRIERGELHADGNTLLDLDSLSLAGAWTDEQIRLAELRLDAQQGAAELQGSLQLGDVYAAQAGGSFRWRLANGAASGSIAIETREQTIYGEVALIQPAQAELTLSLSQQERDSWAFDLSVPRFDPEIGSLAPLASLAASLEGSGTLERAQIKGQVSANDEPLTIESAKVSLAGARASFDASATLASSSGKIHLTGAIDRSQQPWRATAAVDWNDTTVPAAWTGQTLQTQGSLQLEGNLERFEAEGDFQLGPPERVANISVKEVTLDLGDAPRSIAIGQISIDQPSGELAVRGNVQLTPRLQWDIYAAAQSFNPSTFLSGWQGDLGFSLSTQGSLHGSQPTGELHLSNLQGQLRGLPISGQGDLALSLDHDLTGELTLRAAQSVIEIRADQKERRDVLVRFDIASLGEWVSNASGQASGRFSLQGSWPNMEVNGTARARNLELGPIQVAQATWQARVFDTSMPTGSVLASFSDLSAAGFNARSGRVHLSGSPEQHALSVEIDGDPLSATLSIEGTRNFSEDIPVWRETIHRLEIELPDVPELTLARPATVALRKSEVELERLCFTTRERSQKAREATAKLCVQGEANRVGAIDANYTFSDIPLALVELVAPSVPIDVTGTLAGEGTFERDPNGEMVGHAQIHSPEGNLSALEMEGAEGEQPLLTYRDLRIRARANGNTAHLNVTAELNEKGSLAGELQISQLSSSPRPIEGSVRVQLVDLSALTLLTAQVADVRGRARLQADIGGVLSDPRLELQLDAQNLAADIPALGLNLTDGSLQISPRVRQGHAISGTVDSGEGRLRFEGTASLASKLAVDVHGEQFLAADLAGARVLVSPDLHISRTEGLTRLTGTVRIPTATIDLQNLPQATRAQTSSPDVVVVDAQFPAREKASELPLIADVEIILGENITLKGFGLQGRIEGQLQVRETPGEPTTGSGELRVSGSYQAYGQDLMITQGSVLFANTPLDNPSLRIVAERELEDVTAGLRISGTAQDPEVNVFADPAMDDASALSYLVAGRPLEDLSATPGEVDALESAGRSLGTAAGGLLAKRLGERLGLDTFAVQESEILETSALTLGTYLSPRLYLSYGFGLFEPGDVVTLRYRVSDELALRAVRGPEETRAALEYRVER